MLEPLFLEPVMHEKIWGGKKLQGEFGYDLPSDKTGECWAISAHPNGVSTVKNGAFKGWKLDKLYRSEPALFGFPKTPVFPLLAKILDANDWLSVQVHPDDSYAMAHEGELGKTECWYVIDADEEAEIIYGHTAKTKDELRSLIEAGDWEHLLRRVPVKAGDFFAVSAGTMHAIGKGVLIYEMQQSSDTTYRVYDFDRKDEAGQTRELHLDKAVDVLTIALPQNSVPDSLSLKDFTATLLVSNTFFAVSHWKISGQVTLKQTAPYLLVSVLDGSGLVTVDHRIYNIKKGSHFILPSTVKEWEFDGHLDLIVSHPNFSENKD